MCKKDALDSVLLLLKVSRSTVEVTSSFRKAT
jgi:hypothetical protein